MRVLIFTSSGGTAHDSAAFAFRDWILDEFPEFEVIVDRVLEASSKSVNFFVSLYNWIQVRAPWLHQLYWRLMELEDLVKPGTVLMGRSYVVKILREFRPDVLISTHPHINRGHFDLAKRIVGAQLRCVTCCTELAGGFGFTRNWVSKTADAFWAMTPEVAAEVRRRGYPPHRILELGPLLPPAFQQRAASVVELAPGGRPLLVLGAGGNGANNHAHLLESLLPFAGQLRVVALCGRRPDALAFIRSWADAHPQLELEGLGFQDPAAMAELYRRAWAFVSRPGARTATEALVMGCPLIFNHYGTTMPQELLAPRYFRALGIETSVRTPKQLTAVLHTWLADPEGYQGLRERFQHNRFSGDPLQILDAVLHG